MTGRKRKLKPRGSTGRIKTSEYRRDNERILGVLNRIKHKLISVAGSERLECWAGELCIKGDISDTQFLAAERWTKMLNRYDSQVLNEQRGPASPALEKRDPGRPDDDSPDKIARIEEFKEAFIDNELILKRSGTLETVNRVCRGERCLIDMTALWFGLNELVTYYRLTEV